VIRFKPIISAVISGLILVSCATFLRNDDALYLRDYEKSIYMLKEDIGEGKFALKKSERVKLYIVTGDDFIKIYCYPAGNDLLKSERTLLLYLFEDDFENKKFDIKNFEELLFKKIEAVK